MGTDRIVKPLWLDALGIFFSIAFSVATIIGGVRLALFSLSHKRRDFYGEICDAPWERDLLAMILAIAIYSSTIVVVFTLVRSIWKADYFVYIFWAINIVFVLLMSIPLMLFA
jgi:hypothetical protein